MSLADPSHHRLNVESAATPALRPPPVIPDYDLLQRIGRGSYGEVWLARNAREELFKHSRQAGVLNSSFQHSPRKIGEEGQPDSGRLERFEGLGHVRPRVELQIGLLQASAVLLVI